MIHKQQFVYPENNASSTVFPVIGGNNMFYFSYIIILLNQVVMLQYHRTDTENTGGTRIPKQNMHV